MEYFVFIGIALFIIAVIVVSFIVAKIKTDLPPDLIWYDNYSFIENQCPHYHITDVVEEAFANYEKVGTYCMDCGKRLSGREASC